MPPKQKPKEVSKSKIPSSRTRGSGQKLIPRKLHWSMRKNYFTVWVTVPSRRLPGEVVGISVEMFRTVWTQSCAGVTLPEQGGRTRWTNQLDQLHHCGPFQPDCSVLLWKYAFSLASKKHKRLQGDRSVYRERLISEIDTLLFCRPPLKAPVAPVWTRKPPGFVCLCRLRAMLVPRDQVALCHGASRGRARLPLPGSHPRSEGGVWGFRATNTSGAVVCSCIHFIWSQYLFIWRILKRKSMFFEDDVSSFAVLCSED